MQRMMVAATVGLAFPWADGRPCQGGGAGPRDRMPAGPHVRDELDSMDISNLLWLAREANRQGRYDEAARHARAATRRVGIGPEALCAAWMNVLYAAHRTGDHAAAAAAIRSFDETAARLPANDPVITEMNELKQALGLGGADCTPGRNFPARRGRLLAVRRPGCAQPRRCGDPRAPGARQGLGGRRRPGRLPREDHFGVVFSTLSLAVLYHVERQVDHRPARRLAHRRRQACDRRSGLPVCAGWSEGLRGRVNVRHLLTMTSGLSQARTPGQGVGFVADKNEYVIGLEPVGEPGSRWNYSNEGVQLLSPILEKAAGMPLQDYARDRLFRPLGMDETRLRVDGKGHAWTYADADTSLRDFARLGEMMRNKGRWKGRQVVPEAWVNAPPSRARKIRVTATSGGSSTNRRASRREAISTRTAMSFPVSSLWSPASRPSLTYSRRRRMSQKPSRCSRRL